MVILKMKKIKFMAIKRKRPEKPSINILSSGVELKGDIVLKGDFDVYGEIIGNVTCSGKLILGVSGSIKGQIKCENAEISGEIEGSIKAGDLVVLKEHSTFNGDIVTGRIVVELGVEVTMNCKTEKKTEIIKGKIETKK